MDGEKPPTETRDWESNLEQWLCGIPLSCSHWSQLQNSHQFKWEQDQATIEQNDMPDPRRYKELTATDPQLSSQNQFHVTLSGTHWVLHLQPFKHN